MKEGTPKPIRRQDYRPSDFQIPDISIDFVLNEDVTEVRARYKVERTGAGDAPLRLDGENLHLDDIAIDGRELSHDEYETTDTGLTIISVPDRFELAIGVAIKPQENTSLSGLYKSGDMFCTQCEAEGFRRIIYALDRPDVLSRYRVSIDADKDSYPVLLSNGNRTEAGEDGSGRHWAIWEDPFPKPSYLFALVAGDLACYRDSFTTASGRDVALHIFVRQPDIDKCEHAMGSLKKAMAWDEEVFGLEYDLDEYNIVAVSDFNMGAMENKSLNIFNTKYVLAKYETATDTDFQMIEGVIGHEYFHNWTGNRVTCRDWFQLSLKEGLTVFRDQEFSADMGSRAVKRIQDVRMLRSTQFPEDDGPLSHPVRPDSYIEINNFYTATVYEKGAEVIRMMHTLLGQERFRAGMDLYFERHDGQAVTCDDFVQAMQDASGVDLSQFRKWYSTSGTPRVKAEGSYDAKQKLYTLTLSQSIPPTPGQKEKPALHIPVQVGLVGPNGDNMSFSLADDGAAATSHVLHLTEAEQTFYLHGIGAQPVPSLLRSFSAPVRLDAGYSDADLAFLMKHDSDLFVRWDAGQELALRILTAIAQALIDGKPVPAVPEKYIAAVRETLNHAAQDRQFAAELLTIPTEKMIAQQMPEIHPGAIHEARGIFRRHLAGNLAPAWHDTYSSNHLPGDDRLDAGAAGRRALKNTALAYLVHGGVDGAVDLCLSQFRTAGNMTDRLAAVSLMAHTDDPRRGDVLTGFYEMWKKEPLVVDKWFTVQALSEREDTLDQVQSLMAHKAFSIKNPNKVRALIGAFAMGNPSRFHAADGAGYEFFKDVVVELDRLNPQIAARLLGVLENWRRFEPQRRAAMQDALRAILQVEPVSDDVYEIATKTLGDKAD